MKLQELRDRQSWTLEQKIDHSLGVIEQFVNRIGIDNVYISFSGGKDSTVLLWLARKLYPDIKAVFCNTGNEFPDIVKFVRQKKETGENIDIIYPKLKPYEVFEKVGFPLVSKETSQYLHSIKNHPTCVQAQRALAPKNPNAKYKGVLPLKWKFLISSNYNISDICCKELKKKPFYKYEKYTNRYPILGIMAEESSMRQAAYLKQGSCNMFGESKYGKTKSMPLSIWTEDDIWGCIRKYNISIAEIYHKGAVRTGCMFCGFGCHLKNDNRLQMIYKLYPKWYDKFMNYTNNGISYRQALREVLNANQMVLPDESKINN